MYVSMKKMRWGKNRIASSDEKNTIQVEKLGTNILTLSLEGV